MTGEKNTVRGGTKCLKKGGVGQAKSCMQKGGWRIGSRKTEGKEKKSRKKTSGKAGQSSE